MPHLLVKTRRNALWAAVCLGALPATAHAADGTGSPRKEHPGLLAPMQERTPGIRGNEAPESRLPPIPLAGNSGQQVIEDMNRRNDAPLRGFEKFKSGWYVGPGHTMLGNDPRLKNGGQWFLDSYGKRFDLDQRMSAIMPWVVIADGEEHAAKDARVQLANMSLFLLQKSTRKWVHLGTSRGVRGDFYYKPQLAESTGKTDLRVNEDGSVEIGFPDSPDQVFHGWWTRGRLPIPFHPADIKAVFVTMQARLVDERAPAAKERSKVQLLMQVGADYYRTKETTWDGVPAPAVVSSRFKLITPQWQSISAMTFNDVGRTDPPGSRGISKSEFLSNPPPFN